MGRFIITGFFLGFVAGVILYQLGKAGYRRLKKKWLAEHERVRVETSLDSATTSELVEELSERPVDEVIEEE